ncbi:hypothetical protein VFPPC_18770 [Pochonia chlamydosporia 170]|uniref:Uncharacterized protein n=1 Tax=Pochonia chlamydosporia 170 TaxID=1380566 RepID=A0A219ARU5_METCM|nr:hypothetical protein VFPPC_18770 [Pochonia chlamydosporia 170]OWT43503.1 hypothetical protein VFPPC_18770 [Pochonia chlamydosporia 170]
MKANVEEMGNSNHRWDMAKLDVHCHRQTRRCRQRGKADVGRSFHKNAILRTPFCMARRSSHPSLPDSHSCAKQYCTGNLRTSSYSKAGLLNWSEELGMLLHTTGAGIFIRSNL